MIYEELELKKILFIHGAKNLFSTYKDLASFHLRIHVRRINMVVSYHLLPVQIVINIDNSPLTFSSFDYESFPSSSMSYSARNIFNHIHKDKGHINESIFVFSDKLMIHQTMCQQIWLSIHECFESLSMNQDIQKYLKQEYQSIHFCKEHFEQSEFDFLGENLYKKYKSHIMYDFLQQRLTNKSISHKHKI